MEIKTKFNLGDIIWYSDSRAGLCKSTVTEIRIRIIFSSPIIHYLTEYGDIVSDKFSFASKQELIKYFTEDVQKK